MKVSLALVDDQMPRTVFYERFIAAVQDNPRYAGVGVAADVVLPAEDLALETNWPRFGRQESAYVRGTFDQALYLEYLKRFVELGVTCSIVNMHPFIRVPRMLAGAVNVMVADINLLRSERERNARTVSMPALPISAGTINRGPKSVTASFRGVRSHGTRDALERLHNGIDIVCQIVEPQNHAGLLDATTGQADAAYCDLLAKSVFAFVPRGDAQFSYRLLEAMSFGCIPIILSDGWVLPFDRIIDWSKIALHLPETEIAHIPKILARLTAGEITSLQAGVVTAYAENLASMPVITESLFREIELVLAQNR